MYAKQNANMINRLRTNKKEREEHTLLTRMAIEKIEGTIGYTFRNKGLLTQAFTRSSFHHEHPEYPENEVLELIGDSVLSLAVLTYFKRAYATVTDRGLISDRNEGKLSALKHSLVNKHHLAACMRELHLEQFLLVSKGDLETGSHRVDSVLEDLFESLLGAVYVDTDCDFSIASKVAERMLDLDTILSAGCKRVHLSFRNDLQEWCQDKRRGFQMPIYSPSPQPDGSFLVTVSIPELDLFETAHGKNTKLAGESAAEQMLARVQALPETPVKASTPSVNYIGKLQEFVQRQGKEPSAIAYADISDEIDADNTHIFTVSCTLNGRVTYGTASSKKQARHLAAKDMLGV